MAVNVIDFGAVPGQDCTAAFQQALLAVEHICIPGGNYLISQPLRMTQRGFSIVGDGIFSTVITNTTPNQPTIDVNQMNGGYIANLQLTRSVTAIAGGNGIESGNIVEQLTVQNVSAKHNWINYNLGTTDWSVLRDVQSESAISHGFCLIGSPLQYQIFNGFSGSSGGDGLYAHSARTGSPMGEISAFQTWQNQGAGIRLIGTPTANLSGVRLDNCFLGNDHDWAVVIESGSDVRITASALELSNRGGLLIDSIVADISQVSIDNCGGHGALIYAKRWSWSGGRSGGNKGSGLGLMRGSGSVTGGHFFNNDNYGVYFDAAVSAGAALGINAPDNGMGPNTPPRPGITIFPVTALTS